MKNLIFTTIADAKRKTGLSYLGNSEISMKLKKNTKVNGIKTYCIYLSPSNLSGINICPFSTEECKIGCLYTSGRVKMESKDKHIITDARMKKTLLFLENPKFFVSWAISEIKSEMNKAKKQNLGFAIRFNGTSDIDLTKVLVNNQTLFEIFPEVTFYDYTKDFSKFINKPENYHLTFSYSGRNESNALFLLNKGFNVAVVFNIKKGKDLPKTFLDFPVIDGDLTDYRPSDKNTCIVGLRWKNIKDKAINEKIKNSVFVVQPSNKKCTW